nr:transposase [Anaerolineae bacterium]
PYLRASTVRRLNKAREKEERLTFHTKIHSAREMLEAVTPFIPEGYQVYLLTDCWYAAASLPKGCRARD